MAIKRRHVLAGGAALWVSGPAILRAQTASGTVVSHGFATHGDLKYPADAKNLDYVNPAAPKGGLVRLAGRGTFNSLHPFILKGMPAGRRRPDLRNALLVVARRGLDRRTA